MNNVIDLPTRKGNTQNNEVETAWHIFAALSQYATQNPALADNIFYMETMRESHAYWAALFGARK